MIKPYLPAHQNITVTIPAWAALTIEVMILEEIHQMKAQNRTETTMQYSDQVFSGHPGEDVTYTIQDLQELADKFQTGNDQLMQK